MFLHTFYTWLLSNLLHPLLFMILSVVRKGSAGSFCSDNLIIELSFFTASLIISLPCLLVGWLNLYLIISSPYSGNSKFLIWVITAPLLVFLEFLFILVISDFLEIEFLVFSIPGMVAVMIAILIRYKQFRKLSHLLKINNHETNLV